MRRLLYITSLFGLFCIASCNKTIQDKKKDLLVQAMTNGLWLVDLYTDTGVNITSDFNGYEFHFFENGTVVAMLTSGSTPGTWAGDINTQSIVSQFPYTSLYPLPKLNGTWKIVDSMLDYVKAEIVLPNGKKVLYLKKKV